MILVNSVRWLRTHLVLLLMFQALLLPAYGPWLDYRFAALQPEHDHIYFGEVELNHHTAEYAHKHDTEKETGIPSNAVVSLPDQNITWQNLLFLVYANNLLSLPRKDTLSFPLVAVVHDVKSILILPLEIPPRF